MSETTTTSPSHATRWRFGYNPALEGKRDLRIDFMRGIAICFMVINHFASNSLFNNITQGRIYATAAEGFVFISGFVLGMVTLGRIAKGGFKDAMKKLLERAGKLYIVSFILMSVLGLLTLVAPGFSRPSFEEAPGNWWQILIAAATFHLAPPVIDILQLYVLLLAVSPAIFWMLRKGLWLPVLVFSWSLWGIQQLHPYALSVQPIDRDHPYFAFAAWQILYVHGVLAGYYRQKVAQAWNKIPKLPLVILLTIIVVGAIIAAHYDMQLGVWPDNVTDRATWIRLSDRSRSGPIRLVTLAAFFPLLFMFVNAFWQPLYKSLGNLLIPLGQNSLYVFILHVPATVIWFLIPGLTTAHPLITTVVQALAIVGFWFMVKNQILFNIIPR